jgi:hypothetical protein
MDHQLLPHDHTRLTETSLPMGIGTPSGFSWTKYRFSGLIAPDQITVSRHGQAALSHPTEPGAGFFDSINSEHRPIFDTKHPQGHRLPVLHHHRCGRRRCELRPRPESRASS